MVERRRRGGVGFPFSSGIGSDLVTWFRPPSDSDLMHSKALHRHLRNLCSCSPFPRLFPVRSTHDLRRVAECSHSDAAVSQNLRLPGLCHSKCHFCIRLWFACLFCFAFFLCVWFFFLIFCRFCFCSLFVCCLIIMFEFLFAAALFHLFCELICLTVKITTTDDFSEQLALFGRLGSILVSFFVLFF